MKKIVTLYLIIIAATAYGMRDRYREPEVIHVQEPVISQEIPQVQEVLPVLEQQAVSQELTQDQIKQIAKQKKAIKRLASFLASKHLIKKLKVFFMRSASPTKRLLRDFFFHCDFHKHQLIALKECMHDYIALIQQAIPVAARMGSYVLTSPQLKKVIESIQNQELQDTYVDFMPLDEQLAKDDPALYAQAQTLNKQFELYNEKWKDFLTNLTPYIQARIQLRQKELKESLQSFALSMFFRNLGPALGLAIEGYTKIRPLNLQDDRVLRELVKEIHDHAVVNKAELEEAFTSYAQEILAVYGDIINDVIKERKSYFS